jgi:hypothetical protein
MVMESPLVNNSNIIMYQVKAELSRFHAVPIIERVCMRAFNMCWSGHRTSGPVWMLGIYILVERKYQSIFIHSLTILLCFI